MRQLCLPVKSKQSSCQKKSYSDLNVDTMQNPWRVYTHSVSGAKGRYFQIPVMHWSASSDWVPSQVQEPADTGYLTSHGPDCPLLRLAG